jgi:hypothetical protein
VEALEPQSEATNPPEEMVVRDDPRELNPVESGYRVPRPGESVESPHDAPASHEDYVTSNVGVSTVAGGDHIKPDRPVVDLDGKQIGLVRDVYEDHFSVARPGQSDLRVPHKAVLDATGSRIMVDLAAAHARETELDEPPRTR